MVMQLAAQEFIRRFLLHVLPRDFQRICHYGFLANRNRALKRDLSWLYLAEPAPVIISPLEPLRDYRDRYRRLTGNSLRDCPQCGQGQVVCIDIFLPGAMSRGPPRDDS